MLQLNSSRDIGICNQIAVNIFLDWQYYTRLQKFGVGSKVELDIKLFDRQWLHGWHFKSFHLNISSF